MSWRAHYERGELDPAIEALRERTLGGPSSAEQLLLALLLGVAGRWEDAVVSLRRAGSRDPGAAVASRELERCLAADQVRHERRGAGAHGKAAGFGGGLPSFLALRAQALSLHAAGDFRGACSVLEHASEISPRQGGALLTRRGTRIPFEDVSDADELTGPRFEVIGEALLDVPFARAKRVVFGEPKGLWDELFLPVVVESREGEPLAGRAPLLYPGTFRSRSGLSRVGRESQVSQHRGYAVAVGRRDLRLRAPGGAEAWVALDTVAEIEFDAVAVEAGADDESERTTWRPPAEGEG